MELPMPSRIDHILRRTLTGPPLDPPDEAELAELAAWAEVPPEALVALTDAGFAPTRDGLRAAVSSPVDLADDVMAALADDEAFAPLGASLRDAFAGEIDLADDIFAALPERPSADEVEISAFSDGEVDPTRRTEISRRLMRDPDARAAIAAHAELGAALREALAAPPIDVWAGVARDIGAEVDDWDEVAGALREAVQAPTVDVSAEVMAAIAPPARSMPRWFAIGGPVLVFAAAAALLFALVPTPGPSGTGVLTGPVFELASVNDAQVEDMEYAAGVVGTVIAPEGAGDVMVIVVDDSALVGGASPSGTL